MVLLLNVTKKEIRMLIDTHCHMNIMAKKEFDVPLHNNFKQDVETIIQEAQNVDVTQFVNVGTSAIESKNCIAIARAFKNCYATIGTHPNDLQSNWKEDIAHYKEWLQNSDNKIVGIGEIGLDYHYPHFDKQRQYKGFEAQITLALEHNLPIVIHTRDAQQEVLTVLEHYKCPELRGVIHCFSEDMAFAQRALALNFFLGIGGPLTYPKNNELRHVFSSVPLESIVLETDAPFLPPQVIRGKKNSPASIQTIALYLAELRNCTYETIAEQTTKNACQLFSFT